jgi:hypothetical protein
LVLAIKEQNKWSARQSKLASKIRPKQILALLGNKNKKLTFFGRSVADFFSSLETRFQINWPTGQKNKNQKTSCEFESLS